MEGPKSKCSSMSPESCLTKGNNSKLHGVVFEIILTYSLPKECDVKHYLANQSNELTEFSRWLPHLSLTAVTNYFPSAGYCQQPITIELLCSKVEIIRNELFFL